MPEPPIDPPRRRKLGGELGDIFLPAVVAVVAIWAGPPPAIQIAIATVAGVIIGVRAGHEAGLRRGWMECWLAWLRHTRGEPSDPP